MRAVGSLMAIWALIALVSIYGYVENCILLVRHMNDPFTLLLLARLIGVVVAPLGVVLGLFF